MFELDDKRKVIFKKLLLLVIIEICSWLPPWLDGQKGGSQKHISVITNSFLMYDR